MSIQGNDGFSQVRSSAARVGRMTVDNVSLSNLSVSALTVSDTMVNTRSGVRNTVVGFTPLNFSTLDAGKAVSLLNLNGRSKALDVNDADLVHIPANAVVERVVVKALDEVVGATTLSVGTSPVSNGVQSYVLGKVGSSSGSPVALLVDAMTAADANEGACVGGSKAVAEAALGSAGQPLATSNVEGAPQGYSDNLLFVTVEAPVTSGSLRVEVTYVNA